MMGGRGAASPKQGGIADLLSRLRQQRVRASNEPRYNFQPLTINLPGSGRQFTPSDYAHYLNAPLDSEVTLSNPDPTNLARVQVQIEHPQHGRLSAELILKEEGFPVIGQIERQEWQEDIRNLPQTTLPNGTTVKLRTPEKIAEISKKFFGRVLESKDYAALVAAPPGATVRVYPSHYGKQLNFSVSHPMYQQQERSLFRTGKGELVLRHEIWKVAPDAPSGTGLKAFLHVVNAALKYRIDKITTLAVGNSYTVRAGRGGWNGYYTWPRFGFNAPLGASITSRLPENLTAATCLNELFLMPGGATWWKEYGSSGEMVFNTRLGSSSLRVFTSYLKEKARQPKTTISK